MKIWSGSPFLRDDAVRHENHMAGHIPGKGHLVGDNDHGQPLLRQLFHNVQNLPHHLGIQRGGGLVEKQKLRLHGQGPGNGHPLLLPPGELPGLRVDVGRHPYLLQEGKGALPGLGFLFLQHLDLADHAVVQHRHVVEQVKALKNHAYLAAVGRLVDAAL